MMKIELIYDSTCPNVELARQQLKLALLRADINSEWKEWERGSPDSPEYAQRYGSPTVLVDGIDVAGETADNEAGSCRVYKSGLGYSGAPALEAIVSALTKTKTSSGRATVKSLFSATPVAGVFALSPLTCPACWPAYIGLLGSFGIGVTGVKPYLLPLTVLFLAMAVVPLWYGAKNRRGYAPLALGALAALTIIAGMFIWVSEVTTYSGAALLISASIWNTWPMKKDKNISCPACVTAEG